jgi:glutamine synthetase
MGGVMGRQSHHSLKHPISLLTAKDRGNFTLDDLVRATKEKKIELISYLYSDLEKNLKEVRIPLASWHQAEQVLGEGENVDGSSPFKGIMDLALSDLNVVSPYRKA